METLFKDTLPCCNMKLRIPLEFKTNYDEKTLKFKILKNNEACYDLKKYTVMVNGYPRVSRPLAEVVEYFDGVTVIDDSYQFEHQLDVNPDSVVLELQFDVDDLRHIEYWFE